MMNQELTKYVRDWFARADEDLDIAQLILAEERPYNPACFHVQQAAEKYLKGFLAHHEKHARKIHDLDALLQECIKIDQSFESLQNGARYLSRFYVESRYPDDYIEFMREDAEKGLEAAIRIKEFVLDRIKSNKTKGFGIIGILIVIAAVVILGGGYWYWRTNIKIPPQIPPELQNKNSAIDTSTWKTYRNEELGFEFKYPPSWQQGTSNRGGLYFDGQREGHIEIFPRGDDLNFGDRPANLTPAEREKYKMNLDQFMAVAKNNDAFQNIKKTQLNGYKAYEIDFRTMVSEDGGKTYHEGTAFMVFFENEKGYVYQVMFDGRSNKDTLTNQEKQILSTFKFVNTTREAIIPPEMQREIPIGRVEPTLLDRLMNLFRWPTGRQKVPVK